MLKLRLPPNRDLDESLARSVGIVITAFVLSVWVTAGPYRSYT
jgi:hypothetical protein